MGGGFDVVEFVLILPANDLPSQQGGDLGRRALRILAVLPCVAFQRQCQHIDIVFGVSALQIRMRDHSGKRNSSSRENSTRCPAPCL